MLILGRNVGEAILIGPDVRVSVERVTGGRVRLGINAPADVAVIREELAVDGRVNSERRESLVAQLLAAIVHQCGGEIVVLESSIGAVSSGSIVLNNNSIGDTILRFQHQ